MRRRAKESEKDRGSKRQGNESFFSMRPGGGQISKGVGTSGIGRLAAAKTDTEGGEEHGGKDHFCVSVMELANRKILGFI